MLVMLVISSKCLLSRKVSCPMNSLIHAPKKIKFLLEFSFPTINKIFPREKFIGGRIGYPKDLIFKWLLVKKTTNWDFRTIEELSGISHQTLIRRNHQFLLKDVYQKFFVSLVRKAVKIGLIVGEKVAMDSTFVPTFSRHKESGSGGWNGYKEKFGFKAHVLIDAKTKFPVALIITDGVKSDNPVAIPLLKKAKPYLANCGYVLADKGYDDSAIVSFIVKTFGAKAGIPMRKKSKLAKGKKNRYGNLLNWKFLAKGRTFKKSIYKYRTEIERFFSTVKRKFYLGKEFTRGIEAFTKNTYLALISYCLREFYVVGIRSF